MQGWLGQHRGQDPLAGWLVTDMDATLVTARSDNLLPGGEARPGSPGDRPATAGLFHDQRIRFILSARKHWLWEVIMTRVKLQAASLSKVDFGAPAAERDIERGLAGYFVESEAYNRVRTGAKRILIGGRGIGKSAIFQILARREREAGSFVIELTPEDYSYELLTQTMASQSGGSWAKHRPARS